MHKPPLKPKKCQKNAKKCQKRQKMQKPKKWKISKLTPAHPQFPPQPRKCPKKHRTLQKKDGLSENPPKKHKKAIKTKRPGSNISELNFSECTHQDLSEKV